MGIGKSFFGCGTVSLPGVGGCVNGGGEPAVCTRYQPSSVSCLMMWRLCMGFYTRLHKNDVAKCSLLVRTGLHWTPIQPTMGDLMPAPTVD